MRLALQAATVIRLSITVMQKLLRSPISTTVFILLVVFALAIVYTYINASIRNHERELAQAPLQKCLDDVNAQALEDLSTFTQIALNSNDPTWQAQCEAQRKAHPGLMGSSFCKPWTKKGIDVGYEQIRQETAAAGDECYRRYK